MDVMTIFAHQDDETFSAGGVLAKSKGIAISVTKDPNRIKEFQDACSILDVEGVMLDNQQVTRAKARDIQNDLVELIREHKPTHVITHIDFDYHQEHKLVRAITEEAVEWVSHTTGKKTAHQVNKLWAAETTIMIPFPEIYIDISEVNQRRLNAIAVYESQSHKGGDGFYSRFHNTRTLLRGIQADVEHAEAFVQVPISIAGSFKPKKFYDHLPV